jgi:hypothetical protein
MLNLTDWNLTVKNKIKIKRAILFVNVQNKNLQKFSCDMLAKDVGFEALLQSKDENFHKL